MQGKISTTMFRVPLWVMNRQCKRAKSRVHLNAAFEMESRKQAGAPPADLIGGNEPGTASGAAVPRDSGVALATSRRRLEVLRRSGCSASCAVAGCLAKVETGSQITSGLLVPLLSYISDLTGTYSGRNCQW